MTARPKAVAFDVDATSLVALREALRGWRIETVNGSNAARLARTWDPGAADLLVIGVRGTGTDTLGLCRFLAFCTSYSRDFGPGGREPTGRNDGRPSPPRRADAPLLVLVSPGEETFVALALEAGAHSCLVRPVHCKEVVSMLARARAGNQPGRHTRSLEVAQTENAWRDEGGES